MFSVSNAAEAAEKKDIGSAPVSAEKKRRWRLPFRSIRARGLVTSTGMVALVLLVVLASFALFLRAYYLSAARASLQAKAETASSFFSGYINRTYSEYYQSASSYAENFEDKDSLELQFLNTRGRIEISSTGISAGTIPGSGDVSSALSTGKISFWQGSTSSGEHVLAVSAPLTSASGAVVGVMRYITSMTLIRRAVSKSVLTAVLIGLAVLAVVFVSNLAFLRTITEPIASLNVMAKRIAEGSFGSHLDRERDDEIGELTDTINDMSRKLGAAEKMQTEFISSVSHELRTPLTAITGWSETIGYDPAVQGDSRKGVEIIAREAARLTKMVEELLEFTRIQDGRFTLQVSTVDLPALVEDCLYTYSELFRDKGISIDYDAPEEDLPQIPGDPERLSQVVLNILDNACKYSKSGSRVEVSVLPGDNEYSVVIRDHGPGIPPAELPMVKRKFYKGSSKERGSGIGLAVCDEIVTRHNGRLEIENAEGGGVRVSIILPRSNR